MNETPPEVTFDRASAMDRDGIVALLSAAGLPLAGLDEALGVAVVARASGRVVGCAAVERYGSDGVLRSVCVAQERRGQGMGEALVERAEDLAGEVGIESLYLLTETAGDWFPRFGYRLIPRSAAPAAVASSVEFAEACPESALLLVKRLGGPR